MMWASHKENHIIVSLSDGMHYEVLLCLNFPIVLCCGKEPIPCPQCSPSPCNLGFLFMFHFLVWYYWCFCMHVLKAACIGTTDKL